MLRNLCIVALFLPMLMRFNQPVIQICRTETGFEVRGLNDAFGWDAMTGGGGFEGNVLIVLPLEDGSIQIVFWWIDENEGHFTGELWGNSGTALCNSDAWQPSAPSILIPAQEGRFKLEIWGDNQWWLVVDQNNPNGIVLTAQGGFIELIGSVGQDIDPTHYRLIEVAL
jgi:hypothetical protein